MIWHPDGIFPKTAYPSCKQPIESICKREAQLWKWLVEPFVYQIQSGPIWWRFFLLPFKPRSNRSRLHIGAGGNIRQSGELWCVMVLNWTLARAGQERIQSIVSTEKSLQRHSLFWKGQRVLIKTWLPAFVTTNRTLIGCGRSTENIFYWRLARMDERDF